MRERQAPHLLPCAVKIRAIAAPRCPLTPVITKILFIKNSFLPVSRPLVRPLVQAVFLNSVFIFFLNCIIILKEENLHNQLQAKPYVIEQTEHILFSAAAWSQKIFKRGVHKMKRQDHRARVTDLLLRRALTGLLRQKPIQSISVQELCQAAGISRGTFMPTTRTCMPCASMEGELLREFRQALEPLLAAEGGILPLEGHHRRFSVPAGQRRYLHHDPGPFLETKKFAARLINLGRERCLETYLRFCRGDAPPDRILLRICERRLHRAFGKMARRGHGRQRG